MPDLNIRNIDEQLVTRLKVAAAAAGITLRAFCIAMLENEPSAPPEPAPQTLTIEPRHIGRTKKADDQIIEQAAAVLERRVTLQVTASPCPICSKTLADWGTQLRCLDCGRNFPKPS